MRAGADSRPAPLAAWLATGYFALCFYRFGTLLLTLVMKPPELGTVHQFFPAFMAEFNRLMGPVCYGPAVGMVLVAAALPRFGPGTFPRWAVWASVVLAGVSVAGSLLVVRPLYEELARSGFSPDRQAHLVTAQIWVEILPAIGQVLLALGLLNDWLRATRPLARWLFMALFATSFYGMGVGYVGSFIDFPLWLVVGPTDWLAFRHAITFQSFVLVFLLPAFAPVLLLGPLAWFRPQAVPGWAVAVVAAGFCWLVHTTATYFVPHIQAPLDAAYSAPLIRELMRNDLRLRVPVSLLVWLLPAWMLVRAVRHPTAAEAPARPVAQPDASPVHSS